MNEDLTKAVHSLAFAADSLRDALKRSNAVEALLILETIEATVVLQRRVEAIASAVESVARNQSELIQACEDVIADLNGRELPVTNNRKNQLSEAIRKATDNG